MTDTETLSAIKQRHANAPINWRVDMEGSDCYLMAIEQVSMDREPLHEVVATIPTADTSIINFLVLAHRDIGFLLDLIVRASKKIRTLEGGNPHTPAPTQPSSGPNTKDPKNYATHAAMLCKEPIFKKFLKERHDLGPATDDATAAKVRELCGIASRRLLNENTEKSEIWLKLTREFEGWQRYG